MTDCKLICLFKFIICLSRSWIIFSWFSFSFRRVCSSVLFICNSSFGFVSSLNIGGRGEGVKALALTGAGA